MSFSIDVVQASGPPPPPVPGALSGDPHFGFLDAFGLVSPTQALSLYQSLGEMTWVRNSGGQAGGLHWNRATATTDTFSTAVAQAQLQVQNGITPLVNFDPSNDRDNAACGPVTTAAHYPCYPDSYSTYVRGAVNALRGLVTWYQVFNEPMNPNFWGDSKYNYARLVQLTADEVKATCPECKIVLGGMTPSYMDSVLTYLDVLAGGGTGSGRRYYDAVDYHFFGLADTSLTIALPDKRYDWIGTDVASIKNILQRRAVATVPIWITETATYAGQPSAGTSGQFLPMQTETQQARGLVKRMLYSLANGVDVVLWSQITDTDCFGCPSYPPNNQFSYTGLLLKDKSTKKLSYYSMQKVVDWLKGVSWRNMQPVTSTANVRCYAVPDSLGRRNYVMWWDYALEATPPASRAATVQFSAGTSQVQLTELVPNKATGAAVNPETDFMTSTLTCDSKARVKVTLGRNPVLLEALPRAPRRPGD